MRWLMRAQLNLRMALGTLIDRPARSLLTVLGIVIGIVALVVMMALIGALQTSVADATVPLGVGVFQAQREPPFGGGNVDWAKMARRRPFTTSDLEALRNRLRLTSAVGGEAWSWGVAPRTAERTTNPVCSAVGATPSFLEANGMEIEAGRGLNERDEDTRRDVVVIGSDILQTLFPNGVSEALGAEVRLKGRTFRVVGTLKERPSLFGAAWRNCVAWIPLSSFERNFGDRSLHVTFIAKNRSEVKEAQDEAYLAIRNLRGLKPGAPDDFYLFDNESAGQELVGLGVAITVAAAAICLIALMVGGVGVMNIMLVSVMERTREIGVRKALGARPGTILFQFVTEAVVLTGAGGAVGVVLAYAAVTVAARQLEVPASVPAWAVILALGSSALVGLAAGIYPAARASKLDPIEALRYE